MNKILSIVVTALLMVAIPAGAEKPDWAGEQNASVECKGAGGPTMKGTENADQYVEDEGRKAKKNKGVKSKEKQLNKQENKQRDALKGQEKQKAKKSVQTQKELGKGSEKGQQARRERKKWWKFWGE